VASLGLVVLIGAGLGVFAGMLPVPPSVQSAIAGVSAYVMACAIHLLGRLVKTTAESGVAAASANGLHIVGSLLLVVVVSGIAPNAVAWLGMPARIQWLVPVLLGMLTGLVGALVSIPTAQGGVVR